MLKCLIHVGVLIYSIYVIKRYCLLSHPQAILALRVINFKFNQWLICTRTETYSASLRCDTTLMNVFMVLRFQLENRGVWSCVICKDALKKGQFRELVRIINIIEI
jgi:hypothetical protein